MYLPNLVKVLASTTCSWIDLAQVGGLNMEVYVLTHGNDYGADYVIGVYKSREDAEAEGERLVNGRRFQHYDITICELE